ncbi:hypothetical protein [Clostridium paraputrificum]|uniref:Uncharacterized protein n=1 Tax=Clostridium paraputrificum TaxID=29363 RepID=A0A1B8RSS3_9CLOT|nr:hypothetical protein [Clostridium paraputrificum]OBY11857.1 hypothetical protein CP373A1_02730 [Clostridium paraputrificum]
MNLAKDDFYCGAFLSYLVNGKAVPALFDEVEDKTRKIYKVTTNKLMYTAYVKSCTKPLKSKGGESNLWTFSFTERQIDEISNISNDVEHQLFKFVFICGQEKLNESTIAVISFDELLKCIDIDRVHKYKPQNVMIRYYKGQKAFRVYGTTRDEISDGKENALRIKTNRIENTFI